MKIKIIRGRDQIGGSIIEVRSKQAKIILDVGQEIDEETVTVPQVRGLFFGKPAYDAVFVTHYHPDHLGLGNYVLPGIPLYLGEKAARVNKAAADFFKKPAARVDGYLRPGAVINIKDIRITSFLCDHAAFDSYMLLLESDGKRVLYTGDFRSTGRKSFSALLNKLSKVDVLISEGTTLSRDRSEPLTEKELEKIACERMRELQGPAFIFMAATNIDRCVTAFKAAKNSGRLFLQDLYTAAVAKAAGATIPQPVLFDKVRVFLTLPKQYDLLKQYGEAKIGQKGIAASKKKFLMCVRPSMKSYLEKLSEMVAFDGAILFYSMWEGYKEKEDVAAFLDFMEKKGVAIIDLHTSGHADGATIKALIDKTDPEHIIPVHTQNAAWFKKNTGKDVIRRKPSRSRQSELQKRRALASKREIFRIEM